MNPGILFGDHIKTEKFRRRSFREEDNSSSLSLRGGFFLVLLGVILLLLLGKLFSLQIVHGEEYQTLSDSNRMRTKIIPAPRGVIFDRNGTPLVFNVPGFRETEKNKTIHISKEEALKRIAAGDTSITIDSLREYPYKEVTSHVLGYLGQISKDELKEPAYDGYQATDWIGKDGIERTYESVLRGVDGKELIEVDALGKEMRQLGQTDPIPGNDITLTLDIQLQKAVFDATKDMTKGVVIVSKPNGEILAMVSRPVFDANLFTLDKTYKPASDSAYTSVASILTDGKNQPLLNRAISGVYPPGSTFKLITAASGLDNKIIDAHYTVEDTGVLKIGDFSYGNWYYLEYGKKESGLLDVVRSLARSNDIFFYKLAEKIGVNKLAQTTKQFGVGAPLGIDLKGEASGLIPTKQWKKKTINEDWFVGDTFHFGIGQGYLLTTPLQVNSWTQVFANGGTLYQPRFLKNQEERIKKKGLLTKKTQSLVRQGMIDSCSEGGVAYPLFNFRIKKQELRSKIAIDGKNFVETSASGGAKMVEIPIACKTGTAQHGGEKTLPHAWITLFAPAYDPQVVVTVLVESKGEGSSVAAPIAKMFLEAYFRKK